MISQPSYQALALAFRMDARDAAYLLRLHEQPEYLVKAAPLISRIEPVRVEAARIVCEWVDTYGLFPTIH
jgi:hypothetical protein